MSVRKVLQRLAVAMFAGSAMCGAGELPAGAGKLALLDDFAKPAVSEKLWKKMEAGAGTVKYEKGRVVMDMPASTEPQESKFNLSQLFWTKPLHLAKVGDSIRVTWDMQLLEDRHETHGFGICIGDPAGAHIVAGQTGTKKGNGTPHEFMPQGAPLDNIDHGMEMFHYDMTVTLKDAKTGEVKVDMLVYKHDAKLDGKPNVYITEYDTEASFTGSGTVPAGKDLQMWFCVEGDTTAGNPWIYQACGKVAIANVFAVENKAKVEAKVEAEYFKPNK